MAVCATKMSSLLYFTLLVPIVTFAYPSGYYGAYSRTRRDPTAWDGGYGVQQNQMSHVPNPRGNMGGYGHRDSQGMGMGGYGQGGQRDSSLYGVGQYGQGSVDNSHRSSAGSMHRSGDPSYQQGQQEYPIQQGQQPYRGPLGSAAGGGLGDLLPPPDEWDPNMPSECRGVACQSLLNCINVDTNETQCCPKCVQYGCICEGYQVYDCQSNGFTDGMVPEGKSYAVADGTTICTCPPGGGNIMCSFQDSTSKCPEVPPNCVETFVRELDGCKECAMVGCLSDAGEKVEAGLSIDKPPCGMCYCPPGGGKMICGTDKSCEAKLKNSGGAGSLALESSMRELGHGGTEIQSSLSSRGYGGYDGYRYPDYGGQYGAGGAGPPVIPPVMPLGDPKDKTQGLDNNQATGFDQGTKELGADQYGPYQQGYGQMGYQDQYGYGRGGYGGYLGFNGMNGGYGEVPYNEYDQGLGYPKSASTSGGAQDGTKAKSQDAVSQDTASNDGTGQESNTETQGAGQGTSDGYQRPAYPYYPQPGAAGYGGEYGALPQQPYAPPLMGVYPPFPQEYGTADKGSVTGSKAQGAIKQPGQPDEYGPRYNQYMNSFGQYGYNGQYGGYGQGPVGQENPELNGGTGTSSHDGREGVDGVNGKEPVPPNNQDPMNQINKLAAGYGNGEQPFDPYNPYNQQRQYPGYPNQYGPADPSLANPKIPQELAPLEQPSSTEPPTRKTTLSTTQETTTTLPSRRKSEKRFKVVKNRHSHDKAPRISHPTPASTTAATTTTRAPKVRKTKKQATYENILTKCCSDGRQWALSHGTCTGIPVTVSTYSQICGVAQEKCCLEAKENQYCQSGMDTARSMTACIVPANLDNTCGGNEFKTCCDCCAMGLKALGLGMQCDVKIFGEPCNRAYIECCERGTSEPGATRIPILLSTTKRTRSPATTEPTGPRCSTDSECQQVCKDTSRGMICSCYEGYKLDRNQKDCVDVNECILNTHTCTEHEFCLNNVGSYICQRRISCGTGYDLTERNTCEDIDECALELHDCSANMDCENIRGSYRCIPKLCDEGFFTDATGRCIDIDECRAGDYRCPTGGTCRNTDGSYECTCAIGFTVDMDLNMCKDIDECLLEACDDGATCINTEGSFVCREPPKLSCLAGYTANEAVTECIDVDECTEGTHTCKAGSTCINEEGSFRCHDPLRCPKGLEPNSDQTVCLDIDECKDPSLHRCNVGGRCRNIRKSFKCVCNRGYVNSVTDDGVPTCADVDECAGAAGKSCKYKCRNTPGSFECICPDGYKLKNFGSSCEDIDECREKENPCSDGETCFNTFGGFRCVALTCPAGYTKVSSKRCQRKSCRILRTKNCLKLAKQISFHNITLANGTLPDKPLFRMSLARSHNTDRYEFLITDGNDMGDFKVKSSSRIKRPTGVVYTAKQLVGPGDYVIDLSLKLNRQRRWSTFISRLYIFVSDHGF